MAFPLTYHRITNSYFRTCSTRRSRSQLGLYVYTHCMISIHAEPSFERLRYILGGDRPSQTARLTVSPDQIHGRRLETQQSKGGIPRVTPPKLTPRFLSLPPILYMNYRISVLSCSKSSMGSFRLVAGNRHLHRYYNFAGWAVETVPKSLRHSCGSELT